MAFRRVDGFGEVLPHEVGGEAGPGVEETVVDGGDPCRWDGAKSGLVEVGYQILQIF